MRKITEQVCGAFMRHQARKVSNTETDGTRLWLHGNKIAEWRHEIQSGNGETIPSEHAQLWITNAGWMSDTTKERLNYFTNIRQKDFTWYLNDIEWDGNWTCIY